ncbi:hypothetical protein R3P38DRAFT_2533277, partial [Favolaschia claudopus]
PQKYNPHVDIDGKQISKASILKDLMQGRSPRLSTDRTRRVAGISAFSSGSGPLHIGFDGPTGAPSLRVGNPVATIVVCENNYFLAIAQVNTIILGTHPVDSILLDLLPDRGTKVSFQIFQLLSTDSEDDPAGQLDWKWSLRFDSKSIRDVPGCLVYPLNPTISNRVPGKPTYLFSSEVLVTVAASIHSQLNGSVNTTPPTVQRSETFPYRSEVRRSGKACFHVEPDLGRSHGRGELGDSFLDSPFLCAKCDPHVPISKKNYQRILEHNGAHILYDDSVAATDQPCGLCLRPFPMCTFVFQKKAGSAAARQIDWTHSTCRNPLKFQMAAASRSSETSPCTNHLIQCPLDCGIVIWTYNLTTHYRLYHNLKSLNNIPLVYQTTELELNRMQKVWENRQNYPATRKKKNKTKPQLLISDAHRSTMAFRRVAVDLKFVYNHIDCTNTGTSRQKTAKIRPNPKTRETTPPRDTFIVESSTILTALQSHWIFARSNKRRRTHLEFPKYPTATTTTSLSTWRRSLLALARYHPLKTMKRIR